MESSVESAKDYFNEFKNKASDLLKEHFPNAEQQFEDFFKGHKKDSGTKESATHSKVHNLA